jgi:hypothetical protein
MRLLIEDCWDQKPLYNEAGAGTASVHAPSTASFYWYDPLADGNAMPLGKIGTYADQYLLFPVNQHADANSFYLWSLLGLKASIPALFA